LGPEKNGENLENGGENKKKKGESLKGVRGKVSEQGKKRKNMAFFLCESTLWFFHLVENCFSCHYF